MSPAGKNLRTGLGIGLAFVVGAAVFATTLTMIGYFNGEKVFPLIAVDQRKPGRLEMPVLSDASPPISWNLQSHAGKVVVVNYFATWCGPCNDEEPELRRIHDDYSARGVDFVAVGLDTDQDRSPPIPREQALRQFSVIHAMPFPILLPPLKTPLVLQEDVVPQTYVYDRQGRLARTIIGAITHQNLRASLDQLLAER